MVGKCRGLPWRRVPYNASHVPPCAVDHGISPRSNRAILRSDSPGQVSPKVARSIGPGPTASTVTTAPTHSTTAVRNIGERIVQSTICGPLATTHGLPPCGRLDRKSNGESDKSDGIAMDSLITAAARALAASDPLGALKRVALRDDAPALALRGIAMAQLGDLVRAKDLLRRCGARASVRGGRRPRTLRRRGGRDRAGLARPGLARARARRGTGRARGAWRSRQWRACAASRGPPPAAIGRLDEADRALGELDPAALPPASRAAHELVVLRHRAAAAADRTARPALARAGRAAREATIPALKAEVESAPAP